jgi:hypothetical protein
MSIPQQCQHILIGGKRCGDVALRGQSLCRHHINKRSLTQANRARRHSVALPPLEDRAAIQMSLDEILASFAARKITRPEAGTYLFGIQLAELNLSRMERLPPSDPVELADQPDLCPSPAASALSERGDGVPLSSQIAAAFAGLDVTPAASAAPPEPTSEVSEPDASLAPSSPAHSDEPAVAPETGNTADPEDLDPTLLAATHEHDPEPPLPLPAKKLRKRRRQLEECLRNYHKAHAYWAAMPPDTSNGDPAVVLAHLQKNIKNVEAELNILNEQAIPDPG